MNSILVTQLNIFTTARYMTILIQFDALSVWVTDTSFKSFMMAVHKDMFYALTLNKYYHLTQRYFSGFVFPPSLYLLLYLTLLFILLQFVTTKSANQ